MSRYSGTYGEDAGMNTPLYGSVQQTSSYQPAAAQPASLQANTAQNQLTSSGLFSFSGSSVLELAPTTIGGRGTRKWDYVIVWPYGDTSPHAPTLKRNRNGILQRLKGAGLEVKKVLSANRDEVFVKISASQEKLEKMAEVMRLQMRVKDQHGGGHAAFTSERKAEFFGAGEQGLFRSVERARILHWTIEAPWKDGGAELNMRDLKRDGYIRNFFPLHEPNARMKLLETWAWKWYAPQPLDDIREYLGDKVGFYFAFLGFYTNWLVYAAALGLPAAVIKMFKGADNGFIPLYAVALVIMITVFLEMWKRKQAELAFAWDNLDHDEPPVERKAFDGPMIRKGFYNGDGDFVSLEARQSLFPPEVIPEAKVADQKNRLVWLGVSAAAVTFAIALLLVAALGLLSFKFVLSANSEGFGAFFGGVITALFIAVLNALYKPLAVKLTDLENHRTEKGYEDSMMVKVFLFQFVNSYISLFFIGFGMSDASRGHELVLYGVKQPACYGSCMKHLNLHLAALLMSNILISKVQQLVWPYVRTRVMFQINTLRLNAYRRLGPRFNKPIPAELQNTVARQRAALDQARQQAAPDRARQVAAGPQVESKWDAFDETTVFDDYCEMAIQFGYVTLFAAAFPLGAALAFINNVVEIRTDATKLLTTTQRPNYAHAASIGSWYRVLEGMGYLAVITNLALVVFTSHSLQAWFSASPFWVTVVAALVVEHAVFATKWLLGELIPDVPKPVRVAVAEREFAASVRDKLDELARRQKKGLGPVTTPPPNLLTEDGSEDRDLQYDSDQDYAGGRTSAASTYAPDAAAAESAYGYSNGSPYATNAGGRPSFSAPQGGVYDSYQPSATNQPPVYGSYAPTAGGPGGAGRF
eukprot:tig00020660_g12569.t1